MSVHNPLQTLLGKLGVSYEELNDEEKTTFNLWREALSGRKLTDADVRLFLETQKDDAVMKLTDKSLSEREDTFLKMKVEFILNVIEFLDLPAKEKQMVEAQIKTHN